VLLFQAASPNFAGVTYNAGTSSISDITGASVPVATVTFTDTDISIDDALTITMASHNYFTFVDNLDGTGKVNNYHNLCNNKKSVSNCLRLFAKNLPAMKLSLFVIETFECINVFFGFRKLLVLLSVGNRTPCTSQTAASLCRRPGPGIMPTCISPYT